MEAIHLHYTLARPISNRSFIGKEITFQRQLNIGELRVFGSNTLDLPQFEACSY